MNRLLELKEKRAQLCDEMKKIEAEIKEEELKGSWLAVLYKAFPNSIWAREKSTPGHCICMFFGPGCLKTVDCDGVGCGYMERNACWKKEASL